VTTLWTAGGGRVVQERVVFRRIVLKNAYNRRKMFEELLESVPLLKSLNVSVSTTSVLNRSVYQ